MSTTVQYEQSNQYEPFVFRDGQRAFTPEELLKICVLMPQEGIYFLKREDFEKWFEYIGQDQLARLAREARLASEIDEQRLSKFIQDCTLASENTNKDADLLTKETLEVSPETTRESSDPVETTSNTSDATQENIQQSTDETGGNLFNAIAALFRRKNN
ncbi:MAG: hypothetical protein ACFBSC_06590 [Microcoleaceae cyanobacterium]